MLGIRDNLNTRPLLSQRRSLTHKWDQAIPQRVLGQYLLRSAITPTHAFEPFVLLGRDTESHVTICAWTYDIGVRHIEALVHAWAGAASIVVVTSSEPKDEIYQDLLTYIQHLQSKSLVHHLSIHVLRVQEGESSPNAWLNLASVFVKTDYILLWPGDVSAPLPTHITAEAVSMSLIRDRNAFILASRIAVYPFASLVPMVIPRGTTFWCTERLFIGRNRENDWDECLWQFSLEFGPAVRLWQALDLHNHVVPHKIAASDVSAFIRRIKRRVMFGSVDASSTSTS
ncbi:hypothetical protein BJ165DRAFT_1525144 [Panaeolus papilionaceus]|nr:hypothetical protein BJ165DRAFT_1525144 [Panaeolus papilionaceus]